MNEPLFRAKRLDNGEWVYGYYCRAFRWTGDKEPVPAIQELGSFYFREIQPKTLCRFTGMIDKNGIKIFESDIVIETCNPVVVKNIGIVEFHKPSFCFSWWQKYSQQKSIRILGQEEIDHDMGAEIHYSFEYEVIGNIFENPELIDNPVRDFASWEEFGGFEPENQGILCSNCGYKTRICNREDVCPNCNSIMVNG